MWLYERRLCVQTANRFLQHSTLLERYTSSMLLTIVNLDDFEARSPDELSLRKGERIELIERDDDFGDGWYLGKHIQNGKTGLFPEGEIFILVGIARRLTL